MLPDGRDNYWAYKMYDASAKIPKTEVLAPKTQYPGNFLSCLETETQRFKGKHCLLMGGSQSGGVPQGRSLKQYYYDLTSPHNYNAR